MNRPLLPSLLHSKNLQKVLEFFKAQDFPVRIRGFRQNKENATTLILAFGKSNQRELDFPFLDFYVNATGSVIHYICICSEHISGDLDLMLFETLLKQMDIWCKHADEEAIENNSQGETKTK